MRLIKLGEFCEVKGGKRLPKGHELSSDRTNHRYIRARDIKGGKILEDQMVYISEKTFKKVSRYIVSEDDVVVTIVGANVGDASIIPGHLHLANLTENAVKLCEFKDLDSSYLNYVFQMNGMKEQMQAYASGSAQDKLGIYKVKELKIPYHPILTQKKIASILYAYDDLIENNNQRIKLLEEMAEEIYKEWFVRMRFPGYQDCKFFDQDGNEVPHGTPSALPEGWELKRFRDCLSHYIGGGWGEEFPTGKSDKPAHVIRGTDIPGFNQGELNFDVLRYHTKSNLSSRVCEPCDIIFEVSGGTEDQSLGRTSFMSKSALDRFDAPVIAASFCKLIRVNMDVVSPYFINSLLKRMYSTDELKVFQVQSTGISNYQFENFMDANKVAIPGKKIQLKFETLIAPMIDELHALGAKKEVLQETRDLLLPRLISGKLDVSKLEINEPENLRMAAEPKTTYN